MMIGRTDPLPVVKQAKLLAISRDTVYYTPRLTSEAGLALMRRIDELHLEHPFMGQRMLVRQPKRQSVQVGRLHVRTLMLRMGIHAMAPQRGTSRPAPGHKIYPYLLRHVPITGINQVWALDTTYIPMAHGFVYLTAVVDVSNRRVLAFKVAISVEACHATEVIQRALTRYGTPAIVNTDHGSQFTAEEFTAVVLGAGCQLSMGGRGAWRGDLGFCHNVFVERLWRTVKYEHVYQRVYMHVRASVGQARQQIAEFLHWYNTQRVHSSLEDQTPDEAYWTSLTARRADWRLDHRHTASPRLHPYWMKEFNKTERQQTKRFTIRAHSQAHSTCQAST